MRPLSGSDDRRMAWRSGSEGLIAQAQQNSGALVTTGGAAGALGVGSLEHGCAKSDVTSATSSRRVGGCHTPSSGHTVQPKSCQSKHRCKKSNYSNSKLYHTICENGGWDNWSFTVLEKVEYSYDQQLKDKMEEEKQFHQPTLNRWAKPKKPHGLLSKQVLHV